MEVKLQLEKAFTPPEAEPEARSGLVSRTGATIPPTLVHAKLVLAHGSEVHSTLINPHNPPLSCWVRVQLP